MGWVKDLKMKKKIHEGFHKRKHRMVSVDWGQRKTFQTRSPECETAKVYVCHWRRMKNILINVTLDS